MKIELLESKIEFWGGVKKRRTKKKSSKMHIITNVQNNGPVLSTTKK
jgi:hypothetical protein